MFQTGINTELVRLIQRRESMPHLPGVEQMEEGVVLHIGEIFLILQIYHYFKALFPDYNLFL
jgi:hypothetical protein